MPLHYLSVAVLLGAALASCTITPTQPVSELTIPAAWSEVPENGTNPQAVELVRWWTTFDDPTLDTLMTQGTEANRDIREATARVREARALRTSAAAEGWPRIGSSASYTRSLSSTNAISSSSDFSSSDDDTDGTPTDTFGRSFGIGEERDFFQTRFDASWELDVFGRVRWAVKAAEATLAAAEENRRDVLVTLLAEIARNYVELRGFQRRLTIARNNIQAQQESVEVTAERFQAGLTSAQDVAQAEALLATTLSRVPTLQTGAKQAIHRLDVLLGQPPGTLLAELSPGAPIPNAALDGTIGLPSDLLRRRPDIRRAERELEATTARIGVARADLFPRFSLTGLIGLQSLDLADLTEWASRFWSTGPTVSWPVFDAGRIRATIEVQNAQQEQALARYEQTILTSLEEVENALVAYVKEKVRHQWLTEAVRASHEAVEIAQERYLNGIENFLNVTVAQRALYESQDARAQSEIAIASHLIALYKALGGGWEVPVQ